MNKFKVGDGFYFFKNNTDSNSIEVGYKGRVYSVHDHYVTAGIFGEWAFDYDEIKPIQREYAILGDA